MGGVTALEISHKTKLLYTGGKDGDMFWWTNSKLKFEESDAEKVMKNVFDVPESVED